MIILCAASCLLAIDTAAEVINFDDQGLKYLSSSISESSSRILPDIKHAETSGDHELSMCFYEKTLQQTKSGENTYVPAMSFHSLFSDSAKYIKSYEAETVLFNESVTRTNKYEEKLIHHIELGVGFYYLVPLHNEVHPDMLINPFLYTYTIGIFQPGLEFAFALNQRHDMDLISPLGTHFTMERLYDLFMYHVCFNIIPFPQWHYIAPRIGVLVGFVNLRDYRINEVYSNSEELITSQNSFSIGGKAGLTFFPFSFFNIFFEARFYLQTSPVNRPTYVSQGIGSEMEKQSENIRLHYFAVGGGFKFTF